MHAAPLDANLLGVDREAASPDRLFQRLAGCYSETSSLDLLVHGDARRKLRQIGRERDVIGIARVGELVLTGEPQQAPVESGGDEIGKHGRGRSALRQAVAIGSDLRAHRSRGQTQFEGRSHQQPSHTAEVDAREEILQIDVEDPALAGVVGRIAGDAAAVDKTVRVRMRAVQRLQLEVEAILQITDEADRSMNLAHAAGALWYLEVPIARVGGGAIERPEKLGQRNSEEFCDIFRRLQRPPGQS